ncbi:peptidoglycan-binding protein [Actinosynnema sp. NPDC059335]|uniref:peptidoglycan-binding protein n=1 Tax=Actinosynnema sp. NPDC059335 TaxID=3346804 RepID=UPI00366F60D9
MSAVLAAGAAVAAGTGFDAGLWGGDRDHDTAADPPPATAEVTRQTLIDTQTEFGELGYGDPTTVPARLGGTVTALPAVGTVVERGQAIHRVDDTPVVLLYGALPAYRTLAPNAEGADVEQLEANLAALGYPGFTVDKRYTASTAAAVEDWQRDIGVPRTGSVEPGRVLYAAGPVRVDSHRAAVGDAVGPGTSVLDHTGTSRIITVELDVADRRPAVRGAAVTAGLPDGREVAGTIATAETVVAEGDGGEGGKGEPRTKIEVEVTVADQEALAGLDQASVRVGFTASKREDVLTVPVNALLALAEGGYGVEVVTGRESTIVAVETGLFAAGRVEVSGTGLAEGTTVGVPS